MTTCSCGCGRPLKYPRAHLLPGDGLPYNFAREREESRVPSSRREERYGLDAPTAREAAHDARELGES